MDVNEKLDLILKVMNDGFKEVNERLDYLTEQNAIIKEQVVRNTEFQSDVNDLKKDVSTLEQSVVDIKRRLRS